MDGNIDVPRRRNALTNLGAGALAAVVVGFFYGFGILVAPTTLAGYSWGLFIVAPVAIGVLASIFSGWNQEATLRDGLASSAWGILTVMAAITVIAYEGIICLIMAAPIAYGGAALGGLLGHAIQSARWRKIQRTGLLVSVVALAPLAMIVNRTTPVIPDTRMVSTSIVVNASPEKIWPMLLDLHDLPPAEFWLFKFGVACPNGVRTEGSLRHCILSTGDMTEQILVREEQRLLSLEVLNTPPCMKETNPFGEVRAPHLNGHFEVERVEFRLMPLNKDQTILTGISWYHHRFAPSWYWSMWTDCIVKHVQERVFEEIKKRAQQIR